MIHCYEFYAFPVISKPRYFELFFDFPWDVEITGFHCITKYSMTASLGNQLVLAPENVGKIQRTGNNVILQIELIPNIKISMIKTL